MPKCRFHPDASPMHLNNALGDGKPKPGSALLLGRRRIGLLELLENLPLISFRNARSGVAYGDREGLVRDRHRDLDHAGVGEFDGISHEVEQNLSEPAFVTVRGWQILRQIELEP